MSARHDVRFEALRVLAALSIFLAHFLGDLSARGDTRFSVWGNPLAAFGITAFIAVSGAMLVLHRDRVTERGYAQQVRLRLGKLLPMYWFIAIPFIVLALLTHRLTSAELWKVPLWLTGLGWIRADTFWPVVDAWWYMSLAIQIVFVGPLLVAGIRRYGWIVVGVVAGLADVTARVALAQAHLPWIMNGIIVSYAAVLVAGGALVEIAARLRANDVRRATAPSLVLLYCGLAMVVTGRTVELSALLGIAVALAVPSPAGVRWQRALIVAGALTYPFYLSHSPFAKFALGLGQPLGIPLLAILLADLAIVVAVAVAFSAAFQFVQAQRARRAVGVLSGAGAPAKED